MPNEYINFKKKNKFFSDARRWASQEVTIEEISKDNKSLVRELSAYDPLDTIPLLASLLTLPEYQSNCIRIEILIALAVVHCTGEKKANTDNLVRWFGMIGKSRCVLGEDPAEDVFVALVHDGNRDYMLLEGIWEAAGFYTQRIIDVIATMPDFGQFKYIKDCAHALLVISDIVCKKSGLYRYQLGSEEVCSTLSLQKLPKGDTLISRVTITFEELNEHGVNLKDIEQFLLYPQIKAELPAQQFGNNCLNRYPLIMHDVTHITVVIPSALSVAMRNFAIENIIKDGWIESFNRILSQNYSKLLYHTCLLGGPLFASVHWKRSGIHRLSNFILKVDEGYYISFHFFLPSVQVNSESSFKDFYQDDGTLSDALKDSVNEVLQQFNGREDLKEGFIIFVGCGWGKGYAIQASKPNNPHWRFESMSVADLVRLSRLKDMSPSYFWHIQDGLEAVKRAGVQIENPNGILNLIGWVRSNNGHFVPHTQLPEGEISLNHPLILNPPLNLLREVRADADHAYDRHCVVDNTGNWHNVQHVSPNPFFTSESAQRVYASIDDLESGRLTAVYESSYNLWLTVTASNLFDKEAEYQIWEMAVEWLHRIGNTLDARSETATKPHNLKVYVEFRDSIPQKGKLEKPTTEDLFQLCIIEPYNEPNACKAIFQTGFLAGFSIAENVAERLFVRTIARAYLYIIGEKNYEKVAEEIETLVVPNDDARSFHLFHTQQFMDYVKDTLPKELIAIDSVDYAATKIGLGLRFLKKGQSKKIEGREACTDFLRKVVDGMLTEISDMLKKFNRNSTLMRLVANCEKANVEEDLWKRTSAAVLGLHGSESSIIRYTEQMSKYTGANYASRTLIEIALCDCKAEGGEQFSNIEMSKLIAHAALVLQLGGLSDAIHYNALTPELKISPLGEILFFDELGQLVVEPMLTHEIGRRFVADAPLQKRNYEDAEFFSEVKGKLSEEFWNIWKIEMGFDPDEARNIIDALENKGIEDHTATLTIQQSTYLVLVCSDKVSEDAAKKFLTQFSLTTRPRWNEPPDGFNRKDIYPWSFGRRLSIVTRPILKVDDSDDPMLLIAPDLLRKGFIYVFAGAYEGGFEQSFFQSKEMRNVWWGKVREGHTYNKEVAKALLDAGWKVRENIGLPELFNSKIKRDYGDIDVLTWRTDRNEVLIIECKDLSLARNYSEVAALLSDYQGVESKGKPDKLKKHLNRVAQIENNLGHLQRFTGVRNPHVLSCMAFKSVVPMQYAKIDALANTHVGGISDIIRL